ncbi:MAG TPA: c-type cytochrome [Chthoniobacterales bacterium]|jgi:mono/diheme cytochrome c family protein|nr:c-type cytochrome [Chthoniobacterales bacterium]
MIKFILGFVVGIVALLLAAFLFFECGGLNMSTSGGPLPMERFLAHIALAASIGKAEELQAPIPADEAVFSAGARVFQQNGCIGCHGKYGQGATAMSKRMYPHIPPLLPPAKGVTDDKVGETFWVVKNGIRFSGMPSFGEKLSDTEIWQVAQLLHNADKLPQPVQDALRGTQR